MKADNVLLPLSLPTRKDLRAALAQVVRCVQSEHGLTDEALADAIGVSTGTIANVRNERTDLNQESIARLGKRFGPEVLDPWSAQFGGRNVPREASADAVKLHTVTAAVHKLAFATCPDSKAGAAVSHCELADMLGDLKAAQRTINSLIARAEALGMAA
jgi:DNA-binding XRE family transcriptional regulator